MVVAYEKIVVYGKSVLKLVGYLRKHLGRTHHNRHAFGHHIRDRNGYAFYAVSMHASVSLSPKSYHTHLHRVYYVVKKRLVLLKKDFQLLAVAFDSACSRSVFLSLTCLVRKTQKYLYVLAFYVLQIFLKLYKCRLRNFLVVVFDKIDVNLKYRNILLAVTGQLFLQFLHIRLAAAGVRLVPAESDISLSSKAPVGIVGRRVLKSTKSYTVVRLELKRNRRGRIML